MPEAYWIAFFSITDPQAYAGYQKQAPAALE